MDILKELNQFAGTLEGSNDFAFYGLSSKIERPFRDNFACFLNQKYSKSNIISIEYTDPNIKRADLVILDLKGAPKVIIEFTACYAFDLAENKIQKYVTDVMKDHQKHKSVKTVKKYFVLLASNPCNLPEPKIGENAIAYYKDVVKYISKNDPCRSFPQIKKNAEKAFSKTPLKMRPPKEIKAGKAFGAEYGLYYFVFE